MATEILDSGKAWRKFKQIINAQGKKRIPALANFSYKIKSPTLGKVRAIENKTIARLAPESELVPNVLNRDLHEAVAHAVSDAAIKSGVARIIPDQPHFLQYEKKEG